MQKLRLFISAACAVTWLLMVSWGPTGHKVIALIAEKYLTQPAKDSIKSLLDGQSLEDVATWADEVRNTPVYKNTSQWHYIDLPAMITYEYGQGFGFDKALKEKQQEGNNVYSAILQQKTILKDKSSTKQQKAIALKFLICLVGDANQPLYVNWDVDNYRDPAHVMPVNKNRELQEAWENNLIDAEGSNYAELAAKIDKEIPAHFKNEGFDNIAYWLMESYNIGSGLYITAEDNNRPDEDYYKEESTAMINERLVKAGYRLGCLLNTIFPHPVQVSYHISPYEGLMEEYHPAEPYRLKISVKRALECVGLPISVDSRVYGMKDLITTAVVYLGAGYPNQDITVVLSGKARELADGIDGKQVTVRGNLFNKNAQPEIDISNPADIDIK